MKRRYIWAPGEGWVERERRPEPRQHIIRDHIDGFVSQADGRVYESKSQYRRTLREHGLVELGNDRPNPQPYRPLPDWDRAIHEAARERGL